MKNDKTELLGQGYRIDLGSGMSSSIDAMGLELGEDEVQGATER